MQISRDDPAFDLVADALDLAGFADDGILAILAVPQADDKILVESSNCPRLANGQILQMPPGMLDTSLQARPTSGLRLSLAWSEACGARPRCFGALPISDRGYYIVVAQSRSEVVVADRLHRTARVISGLLSAGEMTSRERDLARRFAALVSNLPAPLVFADSDSFSVFLNDSAQDLLRLAQGSAPPDIVAHSLASLMQYASDEQQAMLAVDATARFTFDAPSGDQIYQVQTSSINEHSLRGRIWLFSDVTETKRAQSLLDEMSRLLTLTVENVIEGVALLDQEARLLVWNSSFVRLLAIPAAQMVRGTPYLDLIHTVATGGDFKGEIPADVLSFARQSIASRRVVELDLERTDGTVLSFRRITLEGGKSLLGVRDISKDRETQRLKDEIIANVSHELRTPLTAITGSLAMLAAGVAGALPEQAAQLIEIAHRNGARLNRLVDDLLDMDKLRSGSVEFAFREVDICQLLSEVIVQHRPYGSKFGVSLVFDMPEEAILAYIDPDRIFQVISNLLSNAVKFSHRGGEVILAIRRDTERITISVTDHGKGMSDDFLNRLFDRFSQEAHVGNGQASSGLGLAISKSIIDHHGGYIEVRSKLDEGTEFRVMLPQHATP